MLENIFCSNIELRWKPSEDQWLSWIISFLFLDTLFIFIQIRRCSPIFLPCPLSYFFFYLALLIVKKSPLDTFFLLRSFAYFESLFSFTSYISLVYDYKYIISFLFFCIDPFSFLFSNLLRYTQTNVVVR